VALAVLAAGSLLAGCSGLLGSSPTPGVVLPSVPRAYGLTWAMAPDVQLPSDAFEVSSNPPTGPDGPDTAGHPGHFPGQGIIEDVTASPDGDRLVAVGYVGIGGDWRARAWTSTDGSTWRLVPMDDRSGSFALAVTTAPDGAFVAVGHVGLAAASWHSSDGASWTPGEVATLVMAEDGGPPASRPPDEAERMTTVLATPTGLLAGGSVGAELGGRQARFWHSPDGMAWAPVPDEFARFAGFDVASIVTRGTGFVAIGTRGNGAPGPSVAWTSADGRSWDRVDDPALADGHAVALATAPAPADGLVAVGSDLDEREAVSWTSPDGRVWTKAPTEASRLHSGEKIRMTDVVTTPAGLVGIGNYVGMQYGTGASWLSGDGRRWTMGPDLPTLGQGEPEAVITWRDRLVIVGSRGAPDNYIPTVWVGP
jgi:hypothetical protein